MALTTNTDCAERGPCCLGTLYEPTREEIETACERIRAGWDEPERRKRADLAAVDDGIALAIVSLGVLEGRL